MWNDPAANTDGFAPAEPPEPPEPVQESKSDAPRPDPRGADPRRLEAPATDEEDPLASLPNDFAAFSLTQTHPKSGDARAEPFEQQRQYKTRMCIYGDACPYGPGRCFFAHDAKELRPPQARWWLPEYKTKPCRYAASECPFYADGRGAPVRAAAAGEDAGPEVQDAHVPLRRGRVPLRRELLLRAQRRRFPRGTQHSSRRQSIRAQEELRPLEPDEPPGEPTDVVSRLERLRALRDGGSLSAVEFEVLKQQVLREPGSFAAQPPAPLAPTAPPPPRRLSPPPPDAYMLPAMAMPPRAVPRPPAYAPRPPYAAVPGPPRGYGVPQLVPRGYGAPPPPYASVPRPPRPPDPRYGPPRYAYGAPPPGPGPYPRPRPPHDPRAPPRPPL